MTSSKIVVDPSWIDAQILSNPTVQQALNDGARRMAPIVQQIAYKEGDKRYAESVRVTAGRRPGTKSPTHMRRPFARVTVGDPDADMKEYGGRLPKKGFLRRAVAQWDA